MSSLPLAYNEIEIQRGMTTSSTAIFVPFTTQELFQAGDEALYYGLNALSNNLIMVDRKKLKNPNYRVVYHAHTTNIIALTFVLPLEDKVFTRELWEMATECPVVFPDGIGVVPWMVPGGREIAVATSELMKKYDLAIWAHHGMFAAGEDFDLTFGLMHTAEKSAEILVKMLSMRPDKLQTITPDDFRHLAKDFNVTLPEEFLYEK